MADLRWKMEMEEAMELIYQIQVNHGGRLLQSDAREQLGAWVTVTAERAEALSWLVTKGSPATLVVTYGGRKALDAALASRRNPPPVHWLGGGIPSVQSPTGPVLPMHSYKPYEQLKQHAMEQGLLTQEDIDRIAGAKRREAEEPQEYKNLGEEIFPGTRAFAVTPQYEDRHPLGGGMLDPAGYEGAYVVCATLTRPGAPNVPYVYVTDPYTMEGDSHLRLSEVRAKDGTTATQGVVYTSTEGHEQRFEFRPNRHGRIGQIVTVLRADNVDDARREAYRLLKPFLCDLSYRYDVPIEVLQTNIVELATFTMGGMKDDDFPEQEFNPEQFLGSGLAYETLPLYEFFTGLYRDGLNSHSVDF